jgi:hypothetical protein
MEANFRPVKLAVRGGDVASGREKQRKFLQFVASVFIASSTITAVILVCAGTSRDIKLAAVISCEV